MNRSPSRFCITILWRMLRNARGRTRHFDLQSALAGFGFGNVSLGLALSENLFHNVAISTEGAFLVYCVFVMSWPQVVRM
jgi:hypothetical protein